MRLLFPALFLSIMPDAILGYTFVNFNAAKCAKELPAQFVGHIFTVTYKDSTLMVTTPRGRQQNINVHKPEFCAVWLPAGKLSRLVCVYQKNNNATFVMIGDEAWRIFSASMSSYNRKVYFHDKYIMKDEDAYDLDKAWELAAANGNVCPLGECPSAGPIPVEDIIVEYSVKNLCRYSYCFYDTGSNDMIIVKDSWRLVGAKNRQFLLTNNKYQVYFSVPNVRECFELRAGANDSWLLVDHFDYRRANNTVKPDTTPAMCPCTFTPRPALPPLWELHACIIVSAAVVAAICLIYINSLIVPMTIKTHGHMLAAIAAKAEPKPTPKPKE